jgi:hypothetical protein
MLRVVLAMALVLHGLIHLIGFVVPWRITELSGYPYTTTVIWGRIDVGNGGARALGIGWLLAALAFVVAALGVWQGAVWAPLATGVTAVCSLVLCTIASPTALAGAVIDLGIVLATIYVTHH